MKLTNSVAWLLCGVTLAGGLTACGDEDGDGQKYEPTPSIANPLPDLPPDEWIDLGLPSGTKWASRNLGAAGPMDSGDLYAWGDTVSAANKNCIPNTSATYGLDVVSLRQVGVIDSLNLTAAFDPASIKRGGNAHTPTQAQMEELVSGCVAERAVASNGVAGCLLTSKANGAFIFFPAAGGRYGATTVGSGSVGYCWSATSLADTCGAVCLHYSHSGVVSVSFGDRCYGFPIRPVKE